MNVNALVADVAASVTTEIEEAESTDEFGADEQCRNTLAVIALVASA
jgi:hypothetical protein